MRLPWGAKPYKGFKPHFAKTKFSYHICLLKKEYEIQTDPDCCFY